MIPKFTITKSERLYITDKYICNGHWAIKRNFCAHPLAPKPFAKLLAVKTGRYENGIDFGPDSNETPDIAAIIPEREGYRLLKPWPSGVHFRPDIAGGAEIDAYRYETNEHHLPVTEQKPLSIYVQDQYVPLFQLGSVFAKDKKSPLLILSGETLNDDLVGVVMPYKVEND